MERELPDEFRVSRADSAPLPGERSGRGTDELYRLISADQTGSGKDEKDQVPLVSPLPHREARRISSLEATQAFNDWLNTHRELLKLETAFTDLAIQAATGEVSSELLAQQRVVLEATRALCSSAYRRAFPNVK
jgi:hypothetical protein